jgi:hypothetical protein
MEDPFDIIPVPYKAERLGRMRDLVIQIEADYRRFVALKRKIDAGLGENSNREELLRVSVWLKINITTYRRLNAMSIEGVTCASIRSMPSLLSCDMR